MLLRVILIVSVCFLSSAAHAELYKYVDEKGVIHFSDIPASTAKALYLKSTEKPTSKRQTVKTAGSVSLYERYRKLISKTAFNYNIDPSLITAIISAESSFNAKAVSKKGALGLMQLMPETAKAMGVRNPFNPEENIEAGVRYLKYLYNRFGDLELALAAYNAGPSHVEKHGTVPPIKETKNYIKKIFSLYREKTYIPRSSTTVIYKIVLEDGSVLFTNSLPYGQAPSRL